MIARNSKETKRIHGKSMRTMLKALASKNPGILGAQVCTSDGFEVASVHRDEESHRRLAAMVSSIHALGSALVQETDLGTYQNLIIEATNGKCLMMAIPGSDESLLLTAIASPSMLFGRYHQVCKATCEELGKCVSEDGSA